MKRTEITDTGTIEELCRMQRRFVELWNAAEMNPSLVQTHDLPAGARYSGSKVARGASFALPGGAWLCITAKPPWHHWHDGMSFCRNPLTPEDVRKVVVHGPVEDFEQWFAAALTEESRAGVSAQ